MLKERNKPFILEPVFHGAPITWTKKYFQGQVIKYRKENPYFDDFLKEIEEILTKKNEPQYKNILLLLTNRGEPNWVSPKESLFRMLIKLYNFDFSGEEAVNYIEKCCQTYLYLLNDQLDINDEYEIITKRSRWDSKRRDHVHISISPINEPNELDNYYYLDLTFGSLRVSKDIDYECDIELNIKSGRDIYEDALILFDYYQGSKYRNKVLEFSLKRMIEKNIIKEPVDIDCDHRFIKYYEIINRTK